ncbi:MAG: futalosine hydrolase, partial [Bacteroidia bacterium]|nr:futalosine hydrolase [Bacteroidia bacterium]
MKILLVAATRAELPLLQKQSGLEVKTLVTGVGMVASAFSLGQRLAQEHFDLVINCGIAGAIDRSFHPGEALVVSSDRFYRFGAEDGEQFLSVFDLNLLAPDVPPFKNGLLHGLGKDHFAATTHLREAEGITVQLVHGNA